MKYMLTILIRVLDSFFTQNGVKYVFTLINMHSLLFP